MMMTYFTTMSFWKKIKSILTLIGDISWIYIIKPLQKSVCVFIRCHVISKAIESTIERVITAVYFPSRKDPRLFKLSLNDKFGTEGGDYKKKNSEWKLVSDMERKAKPNQLLNKNESL